MTHRSHFTRATLLRDSAEIAPLSQVLMPHDQGDAAFVHHRLLWTLFSENAQPQNSQRAAFLWRRLEGENRFYILGAAPRAHSRYFKVETKPYEAVFRKGDQLAFDLRVNATVNRMIEPENGRDGRQRADVVMDAIHAHERALGKKCDRAIERLAIAAPAIEGWLGDQGAKYGFGLESLKLEAYRPFPLVGKKKPRKKSPVIGVCDVQGVLRVEDPDAFLAKLDTGFGRAKAFGCGLMLVRRLM